MYLDILQIIHFPCILQLINILHIFGLRSIAIFAHPMRIACCCENVQKAGSHTDTFALNTLAINRIHTDAIPTEIRRAERDSNYVAKKIAIILDFIVVSFYHLKIALKRITKVINHKLTDI